MMADRDCCRLLLHGEPVLTLRGGRRVVLEPRAAALLALAALEPGLTRLRAATLLWPDSPDARRNLRQQLLRFRKQFDQEILVGDQTLTLAPGVVLWPGTQPLLAGMAFDDCEDFTAWLAQRRREATVSRVNAVRERLAAAEGAGDLDAAVRAAEELLAIDSRDEAHHRECMRLHYLAGNGAAGLAAYERLERMLAAEFGTRPSAATEQLAAVLRSAQRGSAALTALEAAQRRLPVTLKRPPLMVGRSAELASVQRALADGRVVWIEGEAGLGKTRLLAELQMHWSGGPVLAGAGRPGDAGAPYATLARWLRPCMADQAQTLSPAARVALQCIAPGAQTADAGAATPLKPGDLMAAVAELLERQAVSVALLDDLHFADEATIELVAGLAMRGEATTRWLVATRPAEVSPAGRRLREAIVELGRLSAVTLAPLTSASVATIVDTLGIEGLQGALLAKPLLRHTGGNPLFVLETLKQGLHDGSLAHGKLPRPDNVAKLIEARLARLSEGALGLARVAAVAGVDFSIELAESAIGVRAVQLASAWQELQHAQVLRDEAFAHDLVSDAVLRGLPQVVARRMHAQCAAWMAEHGGEPARVARHWIEGGDPAHAARAFVAAAQVAGRMARHAEQASLYAQAADAFDLARLPADRFDALCARMDVLQNTAPGEASLHEARALVDIAASDAERIRAQLPLLGLLVECGHEEQAISMGRGLIELARRHEAATVMVSAAAYVAGALGHLGRPDEALSVLQPLAESVESDARVDDVARATWHAQRAFTLGSLGRSREASGGYRLARDLCRKVGRIGEESTLLMNWGMSLRRCGSLERSLELCQEALALLPVDGDDYATAYARVLVARGQGETGRYAPALEALESLVPQLARTGPEPLAQGARVMLASLWLPLGQPARAVALLADEPAGMPTWLRAYRHQLRLELALALHRPSPSSGLQDMLALADVDAAFGTSIRVHALRHVDPARVMVEAGALRATLATTEFDGVKMALDVHVARAALAQGRAEEAARCAEQLLVRFDEGCAPDAMYRAEAWWVAAQAFATAGHMDRAAVALQRGTTWVTRHALPHVPPPFIDSFLHRNPINRDLLAAASR